ncbi:restriction system modified-DNA reader domain-containing protein [Planomonospora parontospora]|uniref:restriction system modified-DNA reader domain-containing protein n=1 Tax=Planomonospora parontospora TaxID=58119 RepID=UPI0016710D57|nr:hypothetical protein [Planomonospora parontospora]GGL42548.1 hypothetical protein GCM10014719_49820 [Planomonospora parontospora subsp. antibiotica]GII18379.1 hypothetical protein Ppa05_51050 [Planomonospora parontospora subsp. antibiotica]
MDTVLGRRDGKVKDDRDVLPLKVLVPIPEYGPSEVVVEHTALRLVVADRPLLRSLNDSWEVPGAYLLLDRPDDGGIWGAYVGKASPGKLRSRVLDHLRNKDHWYRAVLIRRDTEYGFHSAQAGWLEGRLYDLLDASPHVRLHNGNRPNDETLPRHEQTALETSIEPIVSLLHLLGHGVATSTKQKTSRRRKSSSSGRVELIDLITEGLLSPGARIVSRTRLDLGHAEINADGTISVKDQISDSVSDAANKLCGKGSWNGWEFWYLVTDEGLVQLYTLREQVRQRRTSASQ